MARLDAFQLLACEDKAPTLCQLEEIFGSLGLPLHGFARPSQLLAAADTLPAAPDLLLLDYQFDFPGELNGVELSHAARARWPEVDIIIFTAFAAQLTVAEVVALRVHSFLEKPVDPHALSYAVVSCLVQRALAPSGPRFEAFLRRLLDDLEGTGASPRLVERFVADHLRPSLRALLGCSRVEFELRGSAESVDRTAGESVAPPAGDAPADDVEVPLVFRPAEGMRAALKLVWTAATRARRLTLRSWMELGLASMVETAVAGGLSRIALEERCLALQLRAAADRVFVLSDTLGEILTQITRIVREHEEEQASAEAALARIAETCSRLSDDYRDFATLSRPPVPERWPPLDLVLSTIESDPVLREAVAEVRCSPAGEWQQRRVNVDVAQLQFAILTLLRLVLSQRSHPNGLLLLELLAAAEDRLVLRIETDGEPFSVALREAFRREMLQPREGTGARRGSVPSLPLSLAKVILRQHGGAVALPEPRDIELACVEIALPLVN